MVDSAFDIFHPKVLPEPNSGCWLWTGAKVYGYGAIKIDGYRRAAHRVFYEAAGNTIPAGLVMDHLCCTKLCVNPAHLEPVTRAVNTRRWAAAITHCPYGHAYSAENTITSDGCRTCRECSRRRIRNAMRRLRTDRAVWKLTGGAA